MEKFGIVRKATSFLWVIKFLLLLSFFCFVLFFCAFWEAGIYRRKFKITNFASDRIQIDGCCCCQDEGKEGILKSFFYFIFLFFFRLQLGPLDDDDDNDFGVAAACDRRVC